MLHKASFVVLALSLVSMGRVLTNNKTGHAIPLSPRATLMKDDGTFDHQNAIHQTYRTQKYVAVYIWIVPFIELTVTFKQTPPKPHQP